MEVITAIIGQTLRDCDGVPLYVVAVISGESVRLVRRNNPEDSLEAMQEEADRLRMMRKLHDGRQRTLRLED